MPLGYKLCVIGAANKNAVGLKVNEKRKVEFTGSVELQLPANIDALTLGGKDVTPDLWGLAGAFDGSSLTVKYMQSSRVCVGDSDYAAECIEIRSSHPEFLARPMVRRLFRTVDGKTILNVIENADFKLRAGYQGQGIGTVSLAVQVGFAKRHGFDMVLANVAGRPGSEYVGYKVWPKLGYDADIPGDIVTRMPAAELERAGLSKGGKIRISDLFDRDAYSLWETHGEGGVMEFDLRDNSWSLYRLGEAVVKRNTGEK